MASVYYLFDDAIHVADDIVQKYSQRDRNLKGHHLAAILIQRAYRGYVVRKMLKVMRQAAITLQRYIRGWLVRFSLPENLQEQHDRICLYTYNTMATKLQACWKGVLVRKEMNIKQIMEAKRKAEQCMLDLAGDLLCEQENGLHKEEKTDVLHVGNWPGQDTFYKERIMEMLFDRHHLLSTQVKDGILHREFDVIENVLASLPWGQYMKKMRKIYNKHYYKDEMAPKTYAFTHKKLRKQEDLFRLRDIRNDKKEQAFDLFATDRIPFNLSTKLDQRPYEKSLLLEGKYAARKDHIARTEDKSKNICEQDFVVTLKKIVKDSKVPPYYADFWYRECGGHNIIN